MDNNWEINKTNRIIVHNYVKSLWPIVIALVVSLYVIFACQFPKIRIITLPLDTDIVNQLNDIAKNLSYSFVAAVFFFILSESIPFLRRRQYVLRRIDILSNRALDSLSNFSRFFFNYDSPITKLTESDVFYSLTNSDYDKDASFSIQCNRTYEARKLIDSISHYLDDIISLGEYAGEKAFSTAIDMKTLDMFKVMNDICNATTDLEVSHKDLMIVIDGIIELNEKLITINNGYNRY